ncbi:MAG: winged helix-turn-helix domain-containing protein [Alphaproteobacteria bacterium]|nr:winged helix-turn-helix domain-containing protein [Alphaproteobacteria bacterium]
MDVFFFSEFVLDRRTRQLRRGSHVLPIGARAFDVLEVLISHSDRIVSREEVIDTVWSGMVVGDNNLNVQVAKLRKLLGPEAIVTVPRRGLRFALELVSDTQRLALPDRPSVVVLPFSNLGGDSELAWLADGFVEDITTELSRFKDLFVVARNSAFVFRDMPRDLRGIARDLGVRYAVEGSVRATSNRVRVTTQLIDASSGGHVWAENFDRTIDAHFETLAAVSHAIVSCLSPQIERAEANRIRISTPDDLTAHGLAQQAWTTISSEEMSYESGPRDQAAALAQQAISRDPRSSLAYRTLAWVAWWTIYHGTTESIPAVLAEGIDAATRAIAIDPTDHHARRLRAQLHFMKEDAATGLTELRHAHDLNPNCALTLCWLGFYEAVNGDVAKGVPLAEAGLRRSPRDPARGSMLCGLGFAQFAAGNYDDAVTAAEAALAESANSATPLILGTISHVGAGRIDSAAELFQQVALNAPKLAEARLAGRWLSSNPDYLKRAHTFFRVAAGQLSSKDADALR